MGRPTFFVQPAVNDEDRWQEAQRRLTCWWLCVPDTQFSFAHPLRLSVALDAVYLPFRPASQDKETYPIPRRTKCSARQVLSKRFRREGHLHAVL